MKKLLLLLLVVCMILPTLAACKKDDDKSSNNGGAAATTLADGETLDVESAYLANLPERDYDGYLFNVLATTQTENFFNVFEESDDVIASAVFKRNLDVQERYDIEFQYETMNGNRNGGDAFTTRVRTSVQADADAAFDMVVGQSYYMIPLATENCLQNILDNDYIDLSLPWYNQGINESGTINDKLYGASGTVIMAQISYAMATFFNKQYVEDEQLGVNLYDLVRNGQWTYSVLEQITKDYWVDNGATPGALDDGDTFGYVYNSHGIEATVLASGLPIVEEDANGNKTIDNYFNERLEQIFSEYFDFFNASQGVYNKPNDADPTILLGKGKALFAQAQIGMMVDCAEMKSSEYDFGVLPNPMYDAGQGRYYTATMRWELFYIPLNANSERSGIIIDYLNYTSEKIVIPAYWETALNSREADAPDDSEMLHLVRDSLYYDFATFYTDELGGIYHGPTGKGGIVELIKNGDKGLSRWWSSNKKKFQTSLENVLTNYG